jgi:uncharacterized OB-fold protein
MGLGVMLPGLISQYFSGPKNGAAPAAAPPAIACAECGSAIPADAKFCPQCGHQQLIFKKCDNCGKNITPGANFCPRCGHSTAEKRPLLTCAKCGNEDLPDALFCNKCGEKLTP